MIELKAFITMHTRLRQLLNCCLKSNEEWSGVAWHVHGL